MPPLPSRSGWAACRSATRSPSCSTAAATSARSRPTSPTAARRGQRDRRRRAPARPVRPRPRRRRRPRRGRGALRRAGRRAARRAGWPPTPCSPSGRSRSRTLRARRVDVDRRIALDVRLPAHRLLPAALVAPDQQHRRAAGVRRADAGRGPPAAGDRVRPAGRRPRLPAAGRPRALPRGLPRAAPPSTRAAPAERLEQQEASVERFLELSGEDFHETRLAALAAVRRVTLVTAIAFGAFVFLGISFLLARALTGPGAGARRRCSTSLRAEARGDAAAVLERLPACAAEPACARRTRERVAQLKRPGKVEILSYEPSVQITLTRRSRHRPRGLARRPRRLPVVQCVQAQRDGPAHRRRGRAARDLQADRRRRACG